MPDGKRPLKPAGDAAAPAGEDAKRQRGDSAPRLPGAGDEGGDHGQTAEAMVRLSWGCDYRGPSPAISPLGEPEEGAGAKANSAGQPIKIAVGGWSARACARMDIIIGNGTIESGAMLLEDMQYMASRGAKLLEELRYMAGRVSAERQQLYGESPRFHDYMAHVQQGRVGAGHRRQVFEWNLQLADIMRLSNQALLLAFSYFDTFLSREAARVTQLQIFSAACLWLASKVCCTECPVATASQLAGILKGIDSEDIIQAEATLVRVHFKIGADVRRTG